MHTICAAYRMHSCCNPLLHDMQALTASAVSCTDPVVSRLQVAAAEVAVAKLLLLVLVLGQWHYAWLWASHLNTAV